MDRGELKNRGLKHLKNKSKYKGKKGANKLSDNEKGENRRGENWQLGTNRDRYISSSENEDSEAGDFQLLANAPISVGGHFQFKSSVQELSNLTDTFLNLDTNLLNYSIGTIPFNVRCEINQEYLQDKHVEEINKKTERNRKIFEQYLQSQKASKPNSEPKQKPVTTALKDNIEQHPSSTESYVVGSSTGAMESSKDIEKEKLEEWLDDVLNT